jgi:hypothetical protein
MLQWLLRRGAVFLQLTAGEGPAMHRGAADDGIGFLK